MFCMKRRTLLAIVLCVMFLGALLFLFVIRDINIKRRSDITDTGISHLATFIELYRSNNGKYPSSLKELQAESGGKEEIHRILHDSFSDKYEYEVLTNGFVITVTAPNSWWYKWDRIKKSYKQGEAL